MPGIGQCRAESSARLVPDNGTEVKVEVPPARHRGGITPHYPRTLDWRSVRTQHFPLESREREPRGSRPRNSLRFNEEIEIFSR